MKRDYTVKDLCESRGLHDMDLVACDPWSGGPPLDAEELVVKYWKPATKADAKGMLK